MQRTKRWLGAVLLAGATVAAAVEVPLTVEEFSGVARTVEPVRSGVPIPRGENLRTVAGLRLLDSGGVPVPARFTVLGRWGAGPRDESAAIRWVLVDFPANVAASGNAPYTLADGGPGPTLPALEVLETAADIVVTTGPARFQISKLRGSLLEAAWLDLDGDGLFAASEQIIAPAVDAGSFVIAAGVEHRAANAAPISVVVEDSGPGRTTIRLEGFHRDGTGRALLRYVTRLTFYAGRSVVHVHHTIIEGRVAGSGNGDLPDGQQVTPFDRAGLRLRIAVGAPVTAHVAADSPVPRSINLSNAASVAVRQRAVTDWTQPLRYGVLAGTTVVETGARARQAWLALADNRWRLAVGTRDFWRKGPQQLSAAANGTVTVEFPSEPFTIYQAMGLAEEVLLDFSPAATPLEAVRQVMQGLLKDPLFAVAPAAWYARSGAFGELPPAPSVRYPRYDEVMNQHYQQTAAWIDEGHAFGLLNYLDMPSDRWDGTLNPDAVGWGNSYYDAAGAQVREFARRGEYRWLRDLAFPNIRHWFTIDCFDTDDASQPFNGISGCRGAFHRAGFTGEYHYMESLWDYYYLTGDRRAMERGLQAARSYADAPNWDNTYDLGFGPGLTTRMIAQKLNTLVEAYLASGDSAFLVTLVADAEDFLAVNGTREGFFHQSRSPTAAYVTDQAFMATILYLPVLWKYHELTGSPAAREKLILTPQRILNVNRLSNDPVSADYLRFNNMMQITATGGGNFTAQPYRPFGNSDDYMYDQGVQGLVTALCRASALSGDASLLGQARLLFENRVLPGWSGTVWDKPASQQTLRAAPALAYLDPSGNDNVPAPPPPPPSPPQPDALIRKAGESLYVGNNIYNSDGTRQTTTAASRRGQKQTFHIKVQNDGLTADSFRVQGGGSYPGLGAKYFAGTSGGVNITAAVVGGAHGISNVAAGASVVLRLEITVGATANVGLVKSWLITATSLTDPAKKDAVKATVIVKP